ncbi:hypothetical protein FRX31_018668 [Thalictrum thalictroides]|uniref:Uncharacterized protein n=1 Tax=Thalictrum thalictroides TaxID=46969 RepID=A0A7J6W5X6_THATH|nr:hypothetical protein FRX31_018668 [Thalictrum thalictroides]
MSCQIGAWNIRGMNAVSKVEGIVELVHRKNLSLIAAVETKVWGGILDHSAIIIKWKSSTHSTVTPFKFFNHWTSHPEFQAIVEKSWHQNETGNPMMRLTAKLKRLKGELKSWSKIHFSKLGTRTAAAKASLERIQLEIQARPTNLLLAAIEKAAMKNYSELAQAEEASIRQKAKADMSQLEIRILLIIIGRSNQEGPKIES